MCTVFLAVVQSKKKFRAPRGRLGIPQSLGEEAAATSLTISKDTQTFPDFPFLKSWGQVEKGQLRGGRLGF